jgi:hypothetical protein
MQPTTQGRDAEKNLPNAFSNTFHATEMPQELQLHHVTPKGSWKQHEKASHSMLAATFCSVPSPAIFLAPNWTSVAGATDLAKSFKPKSSFNAAICWNYHLQIYYDLLIASNSIVYALLI